MRIDSERPYVAVIRHDLALLGGTTRPERFATECPLETIDSAHRHRIGHLLVELRIGFRRREPAFVQDIRMVEVDWRIAGISRGIDVDDLEIFPDRPRSEVAFPRHGHDCDADVEHRRIRLLAWIVGVNLKTAEWRFGNRRLESERDEMPIHRLRGGCRGRCGRLWL